MRIFLHIARTSFQRQLAYRTANLAGLVTNFFFALLRASVLIALYGARQEMQGITLQGAVTYTGLTQALIAYMSFFRWNNLSDSIYSGEIGSVLLKPVDLFTYWFAQDFGRAVASLLLRGVTLMAGFALIYPVILPTTLGQWLQLALTLVFSWMVSFGWRFLSNLAAFWTPNAAGIVRFFFGLSWILTGFIMPLRFFPDWFQRFANLTPFPSMINTPVEIYLGVIQGAQAWQALAIQLGWFLVLWLVCRLVLRAGLRSLVVQGG